MRHASSASTMADQTRADTNHVLGVALIVATPPDIAQRYAKAFAPEAK